MKKIFSFILFFAAAFTASAQIDSGDDGFSTSSSFSSKSSNFGKITKYRPYELSIGPHVGAGVSMLSESGDLKIYDGSGICFSGGLSVNFRYGNKYKGREIDGQGLWGLNLDLNYKQLAAKTLGSDDLKMGYFEVPVTFQLYPFCHNKQLKNLYLEVGPTFAGTLSSSPDELECNGVKYATGDLKGFDIRATIGLGYRFKKTAASSGFYMNARYYVGTSKLAKNFEGKFNSAELVLGWNFSCIGGAKKQ